MTRTLISTDKNGTKIFHCTDRCFKCSGKGEIPQFYFVEGGVCFECGGSGITEWTEKEYTPEYAAKLEARRIKREEKKLMVAKAQAVEKNQEFFKNNGFTPEGKTFYILGETFDIKDQLKAEGAKWDGYTSHWRLDHPFEGFAYLELSVDDIYAPDYTGAYRWNSWKRMEYDDPDNYYSKIRKAEDDLKSSASTSDYVGNEGDKINVMVIYTHSSSFESQYGYYPTITYIHSFKDKDGNEYIWKTNNGIENNYGETFSLSGTIKGHKEYKGIKQTVLTRCKLEEVK